MECDVLHECCMRGMCVCRSSNCSKRTVLNRDDDDDGDMGCWSNTHKYVKGENAFLNEIYRWVIFDWIL